MLFITWIGIALCISQSAILSGLNLAFFTISKLQLEMAVSKNNVHAIRVMALRKDANLLLVTILWGNVGVNVLLALLSGSVLAGVAAFFFSTVIITVFGEIVPQAYFSRNALKMGALLSPVLRVYQIVLYPIAKPTAMILDRWLGPEAITYIKENDLRELIKMHMASSQSDIDKVEGKGSLNFLALDDLPVAAEGEVVDPASIIRIRYEGHRPVFPGIRPEAEDRFLQAVHRSGKKWVLLVDDRDEPRMALNAGTFLRDAMFGGDGFNPYAHCHRPIIVRDGLTSLGKIIPRLKVNPERSDDDVIDDDLILYWGDERQIITGSDILGRLLRGIVQNPGAEQQAAGAPGER
jgi:metal transporter CNNM